MKIEHGTLVMVADGAEMLVFRNQGDEKYAVLETLSHTQQENPATREPGSDAPGRTQSRMGERRSSYGDTDWHQQAEDRFARTAAGTLEQAAADHADAPIVVIAAPKTLGVLRQHYGRATAARLLAEIDKDLVGHTADDIIAVIGAHNAG
jgi:protein required for attachment to host cells